MPVSMPIEVGERTRIRSRWDLDGVAIGLELRWLPRCSGWYATVTDADGEPLATGRRVEPGAELIPDRTLPGVPPGSIVVDGVVDLTRRGYLGSVVTLYYVTAAELAG